MAQLSCFSKAFAAVVMLFVASVSQAIVVTGGAPTTSPETTGVGVWNTFDWSNVYELNGASGVAVGTHHILTAVHVTSTVAPGTEYEVDYYDPDTLVKTTATMTVAAAYQPPADPGQGDDRPDLRLLEFEEMLPLGGAHYDLYDETVIPASLAVMVGWGKGGDTGVNTFDHNSSVLGGTGTRRWGTNVIDGFERVDTSLVGGMSTQLLTADFVNSPSNATAYEAGVGVRDSGGGLFVQGSSGDWELIGIAGYALGAPDASGFVDLRPASVGGYGDWVHSVLAPEPGSLLVLLLASLGLLHRRPAPVRCG